MEGNLPRDYIAGLVDPCVVTSATALLPCTSFPLPSSHGPARTTPRSPSLPSVLPVRSRPVAQDRGPFLPGCRWRPHPPQQPQCLVLGDGTATPRLRHPPPPLRMPPSDVALPGLPAQGGEARELHVTQGLDARDASLPLPHPTRCAKVNGWARGPTSGDRSLWGDFAAQACNCTT
jgi:hypothetical protein